MNVSLPPPLKAWIDRQVRDSGFGTASEFIRHLVRQAKERHAELEESLERALEGGRVRMTKSDWAEIQREADRQIAADRRSRATPRRKSA